VVVPATYIPPLACDERPIIREHLTILFATVRRGDGFNAERRQSPDEQVVLYEVATAAARRTRL
jgi:hypothetical protein